MKTVIIIILSSLISFTTYFFSSEKYPTLYKVIILLHLWLSLTFERHLVLLKTSMEIWSMPKRLCYLSLPKSLAMDQICLHAFLDITKFQGPFTWTKCPKDIFDINKCLLYPFLKYLCSVNLCNGILLLKIYLCVLSKALGSWRV